MSGRLTDQERADRAMTGAAVQHLAANLGEILGWSWCHWRPQQNRRGVWSVGIEGPLGKGWPDLFMVHPERRRILLIEAKRQLGDDLTPDQVRVHAILRAAGIEVAVVRPSDCRDPIEASALYELLRAPVAMRTG